MLNEYVALSKLLRMGLSGLYSLLSIFVCRLEECVREIIQMSNDLTEGGDRCCHPVDAINNIIENRLLEKATCYDLDPMAITKLLTYLVCIHLIYLFLQLY